MPLILAYVGGIVMDLFTFTERMPDIGESLMALYMDSLPGGKSYYAAMAAHRYSRVNPNRTDADKPTIPAEDEVLVTLDAAVGDDANGKECIDLLKNTGMDVSGIRVLEGKRTGVSTIIVAQDSNQNIILQTSGANAHLDPSYFPTIDSIGRGYRPDLVTLQLELPRATTEHLMKLAYQEGIPTLFNPSPVGVVLDELLATVTHLIVNETEAALLSDMDVEELRDIESWDKAAQGFLDIGVQNVVVTLGEQGAYYSNSLGQKGHVLAVKVDNVRDPTGAGDTFTGTYAVEYVRQRRQDRWDIKYAVERACKAAALTIQDLGNVSIPWGDEVDRAQDVAVPDVVDDVQQASGINVVQTDLENVRLVENAEFRTQP